MISIMHKPLTPRLLFLAIAHRKSHSEPHNVSLPKKMIPP